MVLYSRIVFTRMTAVVTVSRVKHILDKDLIGATSKPTWTDRSQN